MSTELALLLAVVGVAASVLGAIIGAGGGFLLVPALLLLFPQESPTILAGVSLVAVFFSSLSGSVAFARQGRIDYRTALLVAAVALPGAALGALTTRLVPRQAFAAAFAVALVLVAAYVVIGPRLRATSGGWRDGWTVRQLTDRRGQTYMYAFDSRLAALWALIIEFFATLLGIGGGVILVPVLLRLHFPLYVATATSQAALVATSFTGVMVHLAQGEYLANYARTLLLAVAVVGGAQVGARLSSRLRTALVLRIMAAALVLVGLRLLLQVVVG
ncbi:MAG: sulfite exporter TauE/SafE family protein [Dehalococcoidia bacterium]|nr:sulfite exporter TauE/SafE family protein [Dehalococcoidia bacterium]